MRWNKEEITFLKENYPYINDTIISRRLNRSVYAIKSKANRYLKLKKYRECLDCRVDITGRSSTILRCNNCSKAYVKEYKAKKYLEFAIKNGVKSKNLWTKEEIEYLKYNYPTTQNKILQQNLNRSITSIVTKANHYLRLRKIRSCKLCGMDITNIARNAIFCKPCSINAKKIYKKNWYIKNIEIVLKRSRERRLNNVEHNKELGRLWRLKNREKKRADDKAYYAKIKELRPIQKCVDCDELLPGKSLKTKRCSNCNKLHKILKLKKYRNNNRDHCRELNRKYIKNRRDRENQRRINLGLPLIGNNFKKEQELLFYIKNLFPNKTIIYHDRAILGNGWELDIFIPELNLAFEYYGRQHFDFKSTGYWKDYDEFEAQKLRDKLKRVLCKINQIILIEIYYHEKLDEQLVLKKLFEKNISPNQSQLLVYNKNRYEIKSKSKEEM